MARTAASNFSGGSYPYSYATADGDAFDRDDVNLVGQGLNFHDHDSTLGTGVKRLQTSVVPTAAGHVRVNTNDLQWWGSGAAAVQTAVNIAQTQTITGSKNFSLPLSVGDTPLTNTGLLLRNVTLATANQYGTLSDPTFSSAATASGYAVFARVNTAAAAFTMPTGVAVYVATPIKGASSAITSSYGVYVEAQTQGTVNNIGLQVNAPSGGSTVNCTASFNGGIVGIGANTDSKMTTGLVINQGAADDEIVSFKSSDVATGLTTQAETDTYGFARKFYPGGGGLEIWGLAESTFPIGLNLTGVSGTEDTAKNTAAHGSVTLQGYSASGTTVAAGGATSNAAVIKSGTNARFIFQADGTSYEDVGTAWTNFDDHDDLALLDDLSRAASRPDDPIHAAFVEFADADRERLERLDLIRFNDDGHHFANRSKIQMLLVGAVRQLGRRIAAAEARLALGGA